MIDRTFSKALGQGAGIVGALGVAACLARRRGKRAERRSPPFGELTTVDGVRLHLLDHGNGPTVLMLHGNGAQARDFLACGLIDLLAPRYRVIAIDRPGFGHSNRPRGRAWTPAAQAALCLRACRQRGAELPAIVIGHSFGSLIALSMARRHPAEVRGLVLLAGYYYPTVRPDAWALALPALSLIGDVLRYTVSPFLGAAMLPTLLRNAFWPAAVDPRFISATPADLMLRPWQLRAAAQESGWMVPAARQLSRHYPALRCPTEILAGEADRLARQSRQSARLHTDLPDSRLHLFPGVGHMLHYQRPEAVAEAVDRLAFPLTASNALTTAAELAIGPAGAGH